jgi:hypothetical protein
VAQANLKEIKETAARYSSSGDEKGALMPIETKKSDFFDDVRGAASVASGGNTTLDPKLANQAQTLIDDTLKNFDFQLQIDASFKVGGIILNMQNAAPNPNNKPLGLTSMFDDTFSGATNPNTGNEGLPNKTHPDINCETFVKNPITEDQKGLMAQALKDSQALLMSTISGCQSIKASEFVQCVKDYAQFFTLINEHATCDIKSLEALEKAVDQASGGNFHELGNSVTACMDKQFKECGFAPQGPKTDEGNKPDGNGPAVSGN